MEKKKQIECIYFLEKKKNRMAYKKIKKETSIKNKYLFIKVHSNYENKYILS